MRHVHTQPTYRRGRGLVSRGRVLTKLLPLLTKPLPLLTKPMPLLTKPLPLGNRLLHLMRHVDPQPTYADDAMNALLGRY
jgi:hypothetical protein